MSWQLILSGVSAAAGAFNAYDEYRANRAIRRDLEKIKEYLIGIRSTVAEVQRQNEIILKKLDRLPVEIRKIVIEVVDTRLLSERYSEIRTTRDAFLTLRGGRVYGIRSQEWLKYLSAMGYLFDYENRVSKMFDLIDVCEIALVITKERASPFVLLRVKRKIEDISELADDLHDKIEAKLKKLKIDLDNNKFVISHNLSEDLESFDALTYKMHLNRTKTQYYTRQVCHWEERGIYDHRVKVCKDVTETRKIPDEAFHSARDSHHKILKDQISILKEDINEYGYLLAVIQSLEKYLETISESSFVQALTGDSVMYFDDLDTNPTIELLGLDSISQVSEEDLNDYIDGCNGHCEEIEEYTIQSDVKTFRDFRC